MDKFNPESEGKDILVPLTGSVSFYRSVVCRFELYNYLKNILLNNLLAIIFFVTLITTKRTITINQVRR